MKNMKFDEKNVVVFKSHSACYPDNAPFHPDQNYPEYDFNEIVSEKNAVYESVRSCLYFAGLDRAHFNKPAWNPLRDLINPSEAVLLKPNLVKEYHPRDPNGWQYVITHGSIIRVICDYVWKALEGKGKVILADGPQTDSSFDKIVRILGLDKIRDFYQSNGLDFELLDWRQEEWCNKDNVIVARRNLKGDPTGYIYFDLANHSEFITHQGSGRYYGADYDAQEVNYHHSDGRNEYLICGTAIKSDVVINLPKLKTHKKAGITVSLKNLVGINGNKNWLPHHTEGDPSSGGDEHPSPNAKHRTERTLVPYFRQLALRVPGVGPWLFRQAKRVGIRVFGDTEEVIRSGNWWGNDTAWRMCLDLNKIILYGRSDGRLNPPKSENRRRHFSLVDGIIAGAGRGPMNPDPVYAGLLAFGINPASVDAACAVIMGFDPDKIPIVRNAFRCQHYPIAEWDWRDVVIVSNRDDWNG
ncbi:MAG: DUF362 domain-containing protein, partial [Desulfobacteraceae bacterium]